MYRNTWILRWIWFNLIQSGRTSENITYIDLTFWPGSCPVVNNLDIYAGVDAALESSFSFFQAVKIFVSPDNILGIETTLACLAETKKMLITCTEAAFTKNPRLLLAPAVSTTQRKLFKIEDLSCSIWQIFRRICCRRNQFWHFYLSTLF